MNWTILKALDIEQTSFSPNLYYADMRKEFFELAYEKYKNSDSLFVAKALKIFLFWSSYL